MEKAYVFAIYDDDNDDVHDGDDYDDDNDDNDGNVIVNWTNIYDIINL